MKSYDIAIIGAGIQGAALALEAATQGYSVAVIERREAAGLETSSASSKLIHGGLRYLESGQIKLVYECLHERQYLLKQYPELVHLEEFLIPVYEDSQRPPWLIACGLFLYWVLSGFKGKPPFIPIGKNPVISAALNPNNLKKVFRYLDAQTDDRQLTQITLGQACKLGVQTQFKNEVLNIEECKKGYLIETSTALKLEAKVLVNAAGPWVNHVAQQIQNVPQLNIEWVQGTHLILNRPALDHCIYCEAPKDHRAVFVLPWKNKTLVGTTEKLIASPNAKASDDEITYLLDTYNQHFPSNPCSNTDISEVLCGIRVLPKSDSSVNKRSRDTVLLCNDESKPSYVGIYGGKLTSHRATARRVLKKIVPTLKQK